MPCEKEFMKLIPRMYKWQIENLALFFFIKGQFSVLPTITVDQAIKNYRRFTGIDWEDWDEDSMRSTYYRLQKEYYEAAKANK